MKEWYKLCPYCANEIKEWAIKCRFCGEMLTEEKEEVPLNKEVEDISDSKDFKKLWNNSFVKVLRRLTNVLWFFITIPLLCLFIIEFIYDTQKDNYWYYYSANKIDEASYIMKEDFYERNNCDKDFTQKCKQVEWLSPEEAVKTTTVYKDTVNSFLNNKISSKQFMYKTSLYSWDYQLKNSAKSILFTILYSILTILWYIIWTNLLAKIWWYIRNWKFSWWINYKKLFKKCGIDL